MATNFAPSRSEDRRMPAVSFALAAEYRRAHEELTAALLVMDEMALEAPAGLLKLSHTRLRITRAASDSRVLLQKVLSVLSKGPSPTIAHKAEVLEQLHSELREATRRHIKTWPHAAAQADWRAYY